MSYAQNAYDQFDEAPSGLGDCVRTDPVLGPDTSKHFASLRKETVQPSDLMNCKVKTNLAINLYTSFSEWEEAYPEPPCRTS